MNDLAFLFKNFFTHKDFLPPAGELPGTMFTPLHFAFSAVLLVLIIFSALALASKGEKKIRAVFTVIWITVTCLEVVKILWETYSGRTVNLELGGMLPLYPCSIFMYAMPLVIWGKGYVRYMGCGYVCTLGLLGGAVNFFYPANILSNYSCISFAGFHTFLYHGAIFFCALVMLKSGYHSYKRVTRAWELLLPAVPALAVSVVANAVNFSKINSDYMFFKLNSFFFAPIGAALPDALCVLIVYGLYLLIHALPYIPFYIVNHKRKRA
ncbi:MAG: YwaF family protein [Clostridia bacterium]|nr:YwaF family protein [Clostridia bacterium]